MTEKMRTIKAEDVMTKGIIEIGAEASAAEAMRKMHDRDITSLMVRKKDAKGGGIDNFGIVTRKDLISKVIAKEKDLEETTVEEVMSSPLLVVSPNMDLQSIAVLMEKTNIRRFPVVDGGQIIGLVSSSDILRAVTLDLIE